MARVLVPALLAVLLGVAIVAPVVTGHAAPAPRPFETRILHDHNDDSAIVLAGKHGFDSIALDVREARLPTGEEVLVLRLLLNGGCNSQAPSACPTLREVVRFEGPAGPQEVVFASDDGGQTWNGTAVAYSGPEPINDGTRFAIEAWVPYSTFGGTEGATLEGWFVEGYAGDETADDMPAGPVPGLPDPLDAAFNVGSYQLAARQFLSLVVDEPATDGLPGTTIDIPVRVSNLITLQQNATFNVTGPAVLLAGETPVTMLALAPNFTADLVLRITRPNGTATVQLLAATPIGGFDNVTFEAVGQASHHVDPTNDSHADHDPNDEEKGTAGPTPAFLLAVIAAAAILLRRRL